MVKTIHNSATVRIIGGSWRGRKIQFPDSQDLRPTPDRVRETLFNWLQPYIGGAHCLDAFAGSGVLGFEAASRGAQTVDLVEKNQAASVALQNNQQRLAATQCQLSVDDILQFLPKCNQPYDIVFLDPPYQSDLWQSVAFMLEKRKLLAAHSLIYLECPAQKVLPELPANWLLQKDKTAGEVRYCLFARQ